MKDDKQSDTVFVIPNNRLVRDPVTMKPLPAEGADKPRNKYWLRRLHANDVVLGHKKAKPKKAKPSISTTQKEGEPL